MAQTQGTAKSVGEAPAGGRVLGLFAVTLFVSATLLFLVQPMFAKMVLPLLGGTPAVWNTAMLFFQATLLAGYVYAHGMSRRLKLRRQVVVHVVLVLLPLLLLPIAVPEQWSPPDQHQVLWLLGVLFVSLGLPFFVVSTTSPLLQRWFSHSGHRSANDPYFLYAASNLGSMLALLSYPLLMEPSLRLAEQARVWAGGYVLLAVLILGCAWLAWRSPDAGAEQAYEPMGVTEAPIVARRRLRWVALAFVPSSFMLGVTSFLTTDIAAIPLLWVLPLSLYLLTFILVFSQGVLVRTHEVMVRALPILAVALVMTLVVRATNPIWLLASLHLVTFFAAAMVCHGEVARDRPSPRHLTEFYLWIAVGGVLGGLFNALVAPVLFDSVIEYPIAIALACLLRPAPKAARDKPGRRWLDVLVPACIGVAVVIGWNATQSDSLDASGAFGRALAAGVPAIVAFTTSDRPLRFGLAIAAILGASTILADVSTNTIHSERSFFSVHKVREQDGYHLLMHGNTVHGQQSLERERSTEPLTYYHPSGPLGSLFSSSFAPGAGPNVAVIGLGTGAMSCYSEPGERWTFFEIDAEVERIARDPELFTYLRDCGHNTEVVLGDGRLSLQEQPNGHFRLIAVDAFSSDAIPIHLITREAVELYTRKLDDTGVLVFHISNRYLDLRPVVANLAADADLIALVGERASVSAEEEIQGVTPATWVAMARAERDFGELLDDSQWTELPPEPGADLWTDDFSNVLRVFEWN